MAINKKKKNFIILIVLAIIAVIVTVMCLAFLKWIPEKKQAEENMTKLQQYYDNKVATFTEENKTLSNVDVVFLGDSLTDGYNLDIYYPELNAVNRGIGGDTTFGLEKRLKVSAYDLNPKVIVMLIGGNNLNTMFDNYEDILKGFKHNLPNTKVILVSLTALGKSIADKNELVKANNVKIKAYASQYCYEYVDLFTPLLDESTGEIKSEYTTDGAHQTYKGYIVFTNNIKPVILRLLNE